MQHLVMKWHCDYTYYSMPAATIKLGNPISIIPRLVTKYVYMLILKTHQR